MEWIAPGDWGAVNELCLPNCRDKCDGTAIMINSDNERLPHATTNSKTLHSPLTFIHSCSPLTELTF